MKALLFAATLIGCLFVQALYAMPPQCVLDSRPHNTCKCGTGCPCHAGECGDLSCPTGHGPHHAAATARLEWLQYEIAYERAFYHKKPLLIWIGETCDACEQEWIDWVHARLSIATYNANSTVKVSGPCVKVCKPAEVGMDVVGTLTGIPSRTAVATLLAGMPPVQTESVSLTPNPYTPRFVPAPMAMMPPPMMGGFGGGMMMGGCGGGG